MGISSLLNFFKNKIITAHDTKDTSTNNKDEISTNNIHSANDFIKHKDPYIDENSIVPDEQPFYQENSYYTSHSYPGTPMAKKVISFPERKKNCIPSERGLYVAEILLLYYCQKGDYPKPKNGYPGFWWFEYGIRNIGYVLDSLAQRGFIQLAPLNRSIGSLTVPELKKLLKSVNAPVSGKKADLILRVQKHVSDDSLLAAGAKQKYELTPLGEKELEDNSYVPYMHNSHEITMDLSPTEPGFNVWHINRVLGTGDKSNWEKIVNTVKEDMDKKNTERNKLFMDDLKNRDPNDYAKLKAQDDQIAAINNAENKYAQDKNLDDIIKFWEELWQAGDPKFAGSHWHFRLPDLYMKVKRYDEAIALCERIKSESDPSYSDKADAYIKKISARKK